MLIAAPVSIVAHNRFDHVSNRSHPSSWDAIAATRLAALLLASVGVLGLANHADAATPAIATGLSHTCVLQQSGTVQCWGAGGGQLGQAAGSSTPVTVAVNNATSISTGAAHTCAALADGTARCWGQNDSGQLGNGNTVSSASAVQVSGLTNASSIASGFAFNCALLNNRTVSCWGFNTSNQTGGSAGNNFITAPVQVAGLANVVALATGSTHACAAIADGTVRCWGNNFDSRLGISGITTSATPVAVAGVTGAIGVFAGGNHSCALLSSGAVQCWGSNGNGQLGAATSSATSATPVTVAGISRAVQIGGGSAHTCALLSDGQVRCWGRGSSGQLGDGAVTSTSAPVAVRDVNTAIAVSVGGDGRHSCAVYRSGSVQCWGDNEIGQLGNGRIAVTATPVPVAALTSARSVATYENHSCSVLSDTTIQCWGNNEFGQHGNGTLAGGGEPRPVVQLSGVRAVTVGASHSCALLNSGSVSCWGRNENGQVGNGSTSQTVPTPTTVSGITNATALALGNQTSCAILSSGAVQCWGFGGNGQLGNGASTSSSTPVPVSGITTATAITVGFAHACAALVNGSVQCWGNNTLSGQLGNGTNLNSNVPVTVAGISTARAVAANRDSSCAVLANGTVQCWGNGTSGQLGNGQSVTSAVPVTVSNVAAATQVAMGDFHACALVTGGVLQCWGRGFEGQIGGSLRASNVAVAVPGISNAIVVSAGNQHSCATLSTGAVQCFGSGEEFRLGNSTVSPAAAPVEAIRAVGSPNTGWWWNSAESGRGFFIERQRDNMFIAGYIYADDGRANWFVASGPMTGNAFTGDMLTARNGQTLLGAYRANAAGPTLGRIVLTFTSDTAATLAWPGGTVSLTRFPFGSGGAGAPENGWWWNADEPGRGFSVEIQGSTLFMVGFMYDDTGNPIWYLSQGPVVSGGVTSVWQQVANGQTLTGPYRAPAVVNANAGSMRLTFKSTTSMDLTLPNGRVIALTRFPF